MDIIEAKAQNLIDCQSVLPASHYKFFIDLRVLGAL